MLNSLVRRSVSSRSARRLLHQTSARQAITDLQMPAMSPTMTEGGISSWKKRDGESFYAGDVLLEIETDKATIDVEAQDDGIIGKILLQDGVRNVPVGKVIALLAEEGDDISNLQPPKEENTPPQQTATPQPSLLVEPSPQAPSPLSLSKKSVIHVSHSRPLFPSVHRLLLEHGISEPEVIKGTGVRGMLTKGDVLTYLGKVSNPSGTYKEYSPPSPSLQTPKGEPKVLDGAAIRQLIASTMLRNSVVAKPAPATPPDFDSVIADYLGQVKLATLNVAPTQSPAGKKEADYLDGLY